MFSRYRLGQRLKQIFGGSADNASVGAGGSGWKPQQIADVFWAIILVVMLIVSAIVLLIFGEIFGQLVLAVQWGVYIGLTFLLYFPDKVTITVFGGIIGAGGTDLASLGAASAKIADSIDNFAKGIATSAQVVVYKPSLWLLLFVMAMFCLRAYSRTQR